MNNKDLEQEEIKDLIRKAEKHGFCLIRMGYMMRAQAEKQRVFAMDEEFADSLFFYLKNQLKRNNAPTSMAALYNMLKRWRET